jgi:cytidyltransferase-like protein
MRTKTAVVTGSFQYLHDGHKYLLSSAKLVADRVIVLLNSDIGTLLRKGYLAEPFQKRKRRLLSTGLIDEVKGFCYNPTAWLRFIQPEFQVLGGDHTKEEAMQMGGEHVGKIIIVPRIGNVSSSRIYRGIECSCT